MSDLNISKKSIHNVFSERGVKFLIPDYQRPYSWERDECETLWEDLKNFAFPEDSEFDEDNDEYFLGTIVTFKNEFDQNEVIDGQQRLMTLFFLLRAYYAAFNDKSEDNAKDIAKCLWGKKNDFTKCKIISEVATDEEVDEFNKIISVGEATKGNKSHYSENYRYFQKKIEELKTGSEFLKFSPRILENCIVLPIEANKQSTAFRIFTTLNDRGLPLSDSDIFKAQFYKFFKSKGKEAKENFVHNWKELEKICNEIFHSRKGTPTDDLFKKYMYYLRAKNNDGDRFKGLRVYYEKNDYAILKDPKTFENLTDLLNFWNDIFQRNEERFSTRILKRIYVLKYSPYTVWENIVSIYFIGNREHWDEEKFYRFLNQITALMLTQAIVQPGVQSIRLPFLLEFENILNDERLKFANYKREEKFLRTQFFNMKFSNSKKITYAMLAWWLLQDENQDLPPLDTKLEIEHIYAKKRHEFDPLKNAENLDLLGNKVLLEKRINIRASDYRFADKKKYYLGKANNKNDVPTFNLELQYLAEECEDFTEIDIIDRNEEIFNGFIDYLEQNNLLS